MALPWPRPADGNKGSISVRTLLIAGGLLRAGLIAVAAVQDAMAEVPYTDIDYRVFSEAAESVYLGLSPYEGRTALLSNPETKYRYSPLLAYMLLPNMWLHPCWGKILFSSLDLVAVWPLMRLLRANSPSGDGTQLRLGVMALLFNPFTFTISTRGSCESVVVLLLYCLLDALQLRSNVSLAAVIFGVAVHFRVYPAIFGLPLLLSAGSLNGRQQGLRSIFSLRAIQFAAVAAATFFVLLGIFYCLYGEDFVMAAYLHHGTRIDTQHNFSVYFYPLRFFPDLARLSLLPQLMASAVLGWLGGAPAKAMLLQALAFVALNRVITAQYFVWWLALLPVALPWLTLDFALVRGLVFWAIAEVHWLAWAYLLEFRQWPVAEGVWIASLGFLATELYLIALLARSPKKGED